MIGELHLILGCMFSGKSSELIKIRSKYKILGKSLLAINHTIDTRYGSNKIITHDKKEIQCTQISTLMSIVSTDNYIYSDVILIEEAHFFEDLYDFTQYSVNKMNKIVYIAGLNGDYKQHLIGDIYKLIPMCDTLVKLSALCVICKDGTPAHFTKRIDGKESQIVVGSTDSYIPVCRRHHIDG